LQKAQNRDGGEQKAEGVRAGVLCIDDLNGVDGAKQSGKEPDFEIEQDSSNQENEVNDKRARQRGQ
jgi:hypothetical protein